MVEVIPALDPAGKRGHGILVVRKDGRIAVTADELRRLEPDEPRESASLLYNVELLSERIAEFWSSDTATLRIEAELLQAELATMTGSKSWKLTEPLRRLRGLASRR